MVLGRRWSARRLAAVFRRHGDKRRPDKTLIALFGQFDGPDNILW